jgi:hypothetical protein
MITFLLLAILIVLILGFWGKAAFDKLVLIDIGALSIAFLIVALVVLGLSIGGIVSLWNSNAVSFWNSTIVPFWNANAEIIVPPLGTIIGAPLWIYLAVEVFKHLINSIRTYSIANDSTFEKAVFFVVGMPVIIAWLGIVVLIFVGPIVALFVAMQKWLVVVPAT